MAAAVARLASVEADALVAGDCLPRGAVRGAVRAEASLQPPSARARAVDSSKRARAVYSSESAGAPPSAAHEEARRECAERKPRIFQRPSSRPISASSRQLRLGLISGTRKGLGRISSEISLDSLKGMEGGFSPPRVFATASE